MEKRELIELSKLGQESRSLDYKESVSWKDYQKKYAKTALGMANIRDGGIIIVGVEEVERNKFVRKGVLEEHLKAYNSDEMLAYINNYADPYIRLEVILFEDDQMNFIAIVIHEFDDIPVVCKGNKGNKELRKGAMYTRSHRMPETCEVPSQTEMREILDLAAEKGLRKFLQRARRAGIEMEGGKIETDEDKFNQQLDGL
ncbi:hypothetical protein CEE37_10010 [candidate division LCP-89 bacterium B3_LCP]|uniref:Schlafen AlbA-2 domain-containing protein n=1 Tax=candidate division LCP-89 bacterium B3_LCP TaxID=2012998 RepID=A0A532UYS5_UNCL8|nr:MAG: hypothetical protein CEE37_10010 [candidate division LCP-89 bacterium B3_LCP]